MASISARMLRRRWSRCFRWISELRRMFRRTTDVRTPNETDARDDTVTRLLKSLRDGVEALKDPEIERKVQSYFEQHPNYSCDLIHVAAVACGFQAAKQRATAPAQSVPIAKTISPRT